MSDWVLVALNAELGRGIAMNTDTTKTNWQPIETIPLDQCVDVWVTSKHTSEYGQRLTNVWKSTTHSKVWVGVEEWQIPTHWMPLPQPPM